MAKSFFQSEGRCMEFHNFNTPFLIYFLRAMGCIFHNDPLEWNLQTSQKLHVLQIVLLVKALITYKDKDFQRWWILSLSVFTS